MFSDKTKWILVPFIVSGCLAALLFQNCAQQKNSDSSAIASYSSGVQKIILEPGSQASDNTCFEGRVKCYKKIYSPDVLDSFAKSSECVMIEDHSVCFDLDINTYDTRDALANCSNCDESAAVFKGRYNREEISCWLYVGASGNAPFFSVRDNLKEALSDNLNSCRISLLTKGE